MRKVELSAVTYSILVFGHYMVNPYIVTFAFTFSLLQNFIGGIDTLLNHHLCFILLVYLFPVRILLEVRKLSPWLKT